MVKLRISDDLQLPIDAVTQRISILGRTRSGKSHTAGVLVEEVLKARQQVVIMDPKGDWWGLRSSADGRSEGLQITIMGGAHGDIPLEPAAGALIADVVITEGISVVLDLSLFESKADEIRFVTAFLDRFYRKNTEPVLLVIDEADVFAPQKPEKNETVMLNRMETICRRGAGRGIGVVLISQRSASIHKGCLSQTELMIAHQTTAPQDKDAIEKWVVDHDNEERRDSFMARVPKLPQGTAIAWSPSWLEIYKEVGIRQKETYDSSASPRVGRRRTPPKVLAQVDLDRLKKHMAETIEKVRQEDPKLLRAEISRLKAELAAKPKAVVSAPASKTVKVEVQKTVEVPALGKRQINALNKAVAASVAGSKDALAAASFLDQASKAIADALGKFLKSVHRQMPALPMKEHEKMKVAAALESKVGQSWKRNPASPLNRQRDTASVASEDVSLDKAERSILAVLAQNPDGCLIGKLTLLAGYRLSGGFRNSLSSLRSKGYMTGTNTSVMTATPEGLAALGAFEPLPQGAALAAYWLNHRSFGACERKCLAEFIENPDGLTIDELAQLTGYGVSGGFRNALSSLRTAGVIVGKNTEKMRATADLLGVTV